MPRKPVFAASSALRIPQLRRHRPSGRAVVTLNGRDFYVGSWGTIAAKAEYDRLIGEWLANGRRLDANDLRVAELVERYLEFARVYYKTERSTGEYDPIYRALDTLLDLYATERVVDFGPLMLKAVRQKWIDAGKVRPQINKNVHRVRRMFRWGVENELVPSEVLNALSAVAGLREGKCAAPESTPVSPVENARVDAVLPRLPPPVRAMVELQRLSGMRPGEVVQMMASAIDRSGEVWKYIPSHHKTKHLGRRRTIYLGRACQAILGPLVEGRDASTPLFAPREAVDAVRRRRSEARSTPLSCGNRSGTNRRAAPSRQPGLAYTPATYARAIRRACDAAGVPPWSPNQLRHSFATQIRRQHGLEAAQVLLGHARADVTQLYAERDHQLAEKITTALG